MIVSFNDLKQDELVTFFLKKKKMKKKKGKKKGLKAITMEHKPGMLMISLGTWVVARFIALEAEWLI